MPEANEPKFVRAVEAGALITGEVLLMLGANMLAHEIIPHDSPSTIHNRQVMKCAEELSTVTKRIDLDDFPVACDDYEAEMDRHYTPTELFGVEKVTVDMPPKDEFVAAHTEGRIEDARASADAYANAELALGIAGMIFVYFGVRPGIRTYRMIREKERITSELAASHANDIEFGFMNNLKKYPPTEQ